MMNPWIIAAVTAAALILSNTVSFSLMRRDKLLAKAGQRRIPEKTLFLSAALFGGLGGVLGMRVMRHKTRHWYFAFFFPVMLVAQLLLLIWGGIALFS